MDLKDIKTNAEAIFKLLKSFGYGYDDIRLTLRKIDDLNEDDQEPNEFDVQIHLTKE